MADIVNKVYLEEITTTTCLSPVSALYINSEDLKEGMTHWRRPQVPLFTQ